MITAGITTDQIDRLALCIRTLEWPREQITLFLLKHWQVERLSHLSAAQADAAIAALVEALAVWATPEDEAPTPNLQPPITEDADWDALPRVDRPDAPVLPEAVTAIANLFAALHWHEQHCVNYLQKNWRVATARHLTIAQAEVALADLDARLSLMPQGVTREALHAQQQEATS